jgi:hypothetical protein
MPTATLRKGAAVSRKQLQCIQCQHQSKLKRCVERLCDACSCKCPAHVLHRRRNFERHARATFAGHSIHSLTEDILTNAAVQPTMNITPDADAMNRGGDEECVDFGMDVPDTSTISFDLPGGDFGWAVGGEDTTSRVFDIDFAAR